jgi:chemotaxis methyl-accepting protein methylase
MAPERPNSASASPEETWVVRALIERQFGIVFAESREAWLAQRIAEHARERQLSRAELLRAVALSAGECQDLLDRLLPREAEFFSYAGALQALANRVLPELHIKKFWEKPRTLRVWDLDCSMGEEAYSIAMTLCDTMDLQENWKVQIIAGGMSRQGLEHADRGVYSARALTALTPRQLSTHLMPLGDQFLVKQRLRNMIRFLPLQLLESRDLGRFDCIFCLRLCEYVAPERRAPLLQQFFETLEHGGYLFWGGPPVADPALKLNQIIAGDFHLLQKPVNGARWFTPPPAAQFGTQP